MIENLRSIIKFGVVVILILFSILLTSCSQNNVHEEDPVADILVNDRYLPDDWISEGVLSGYDNPAILDDHPGAIDFAVTSVLSQII